MFAKESLASRSIWRRIGTPRSRSLPVAYGEGLGLQGVARFQWLMEKDWDAMQGIARFPWLMEKDWDGKESLASRGLWKRIETPRIRSLSVAYGEGLGLQGVARFPWRMEKEWDSKESLASRGVWRRSGTPFSATTGYLIKCLQMN